MDVSKLISNYCICLLRVYQTIIKIVPGGPGPVEGYGMRDCHPNATEESVSEE